MTCFPQATDAAGEEDGAGHRPDPARPAASRIPQQPSSPSTPDGGARGIPCPSRLPILVPRHVSSPAQSATGECRWTGALQATEWFQKGLLTFLRSLYKEVAKTTSGTLVYRVDRQTNRKNISSFEKHCVLDSECSILSQEPSDCCILYFNVIFHGK